jgi:enterochelin esterase-like enzyme
MTHPALAALMAGGAPDAAALREFLRANKFPLVAAGGVTFVYAGEADAVNLRCWISGLSAAQPLERIADTALWVRYLELPPGSRLEYKFERSHGGHNELVLDPLNPVQATDPFGANSVCQAQGYQRPDWTLEDTQARRGSFEELNIASAALGGQRRTLVYVPARFRRSRRYPLLIVHDGEDYLRFAALRTVLDNLIHRLEIAPLIVACTQSPNRLVEYAGHDAHGRFVVEELLLSLRAQFPLEDTSDSRGLMGASFGAVASLHTAWRYPGMFGRLGLQSGSFAFSDLGEHKRGPVFDPVVKFVNAFRAAPGLPTERAYVSCGVYESLIYENRSMLPLLRDRGIDVRYEEARDAHNWENWRDRLRSGLSFLFPGPLWMVYE